MAIAIGWGKGLSGKNILKLGLRHASYSRVCHSKATF